MNFRLDDSRLYFCFSGTELMLSETRNGVWRLQSAKSGGFDSNGAAQTLSKDLGESFDESISELEASRTDGGITVFAPDGTSVKITESSIGFYDKSKKLRREVKKIVPANDGVKTILSLDSVERIYGTGERFNRVDQRGKRVHIYAIDRWCQTEGNSYIPVPFVISSNLSAVFFNRFEHSVFNIGCFPRGAMTVEQKYAPIDMFVFIAEDPAEILTAYSRITGFAPLPPEWAFGTLVCRYHPEFSSKEGIYAMADAMKENGFPWDAVIVEGWGAYKKEKWGDLKEVCEKFHAMGKKVMVYEQCGKFPSNRDDFGLEDRFAVQSDEGVELKETRSMNLLDNFHHKKMRCVDLTDPASVEKWEQLWNELLYDIGIDGAKIDFCEQFPDKPIIHFSDGRDPMAAHHWFPVLYNTLRYKHFSSKPDGGLNFSRGGGIGAQRYPFVWAGDQLREYHFLRAVVKAALSCGLSGIPFVSWDMAGYQPALNPFDKRREDKIFLRGTEFTAFSPVIQTHGKVKRPYDFDSHTRDVYRAYSNLHEALRPYLIEQAKISCETGLPMMRHLFLFDHSDKNCLDTEDEYMLGCGLLIAPVLNSAGKRDIYLPAGRWINIFSKKKYEGGITLRKFEAPLEMIPVFMLEGALSQALLPSLEAAQKYIEEINRLSK